MKMIGMSGAIDSDALLQLEAADVRKSDVEYQAARSKELVGEDRNSRAEANVSGCQPCGVDQQLQRSADRDVVVDDKYDWGCV
mgnify:CR=1 FL=1